MVRPRGIPDGARWTPVPDLFFSRYLPELKDPVAAKAYLHIVWRMHRRERASPAALRAADLIADAPLRRGARAVGTREVEIESLLSASFDHLVSKGLLLEALVEGSEGPERWLFVNCREGRATYDRWENGGLVLPARGIEMEGADAEPTVYELYEENIGLLTPMLADELRDAAATYPPSWIEEAIRLAVDNNARKWSYVRAVLERWGREGRGDADHEAHRRPDGTVRGRDPEDPYAPYIRH